jgi:hypothetical protein
MRVDQAGEKSASLGVDHLGLGGAAFEDAGVRSNGEDSAVLDRHGFGGAEMCIDSEDFGVVKDEIGGEARDGEAEEAEKSHGIRKCT